jgi:hypothetical protein
VVGPERTAMVMTSGSAGCGREQPLERKAECEMQNAKQSLAIAPAFLHFAFCILNYTLQLF